ncbi:FtsW/RodA/SpoVE family cell cycle protein [Deinococcus roseus]|uniref:Cell division protein FtsW n=1 Tax=Deinococcus roseus TaxID=392414 RepID=A0ABQ2CTV4_9DEIO|nr:FtsW/RodA/SpoVE family cell cycle protein [Deinococcus roseus]GGJ20001.1 cell division protein FtsW [Deinococcus roseus]
MLYEGTLKPALTLKSRQYHQLLWLSQGILAVLGLVGVATAMPGELIGHGMQTTIAFVATWLFALMRPKGVIRIAPFMWVISLVLLVMVMVMGEGGNASDVKRWLDFGPIRFQPSELAKLTLIMQLGSAFARKGVNAKLWQSSLMIMATVGLVIIEPDLGTSVLIFASGILMMFAAGVRFTSISALILSLFLLALPFASSYLERNPYIVERFFGHVNTVKGQDTSQDSGYQVKQARKAMERGGLWGQGVDGRLPRLPAKDTDMIIASVAFATGFLGVAMIILAYWLVAYVGLGASEMVVSAGTFRPHLHAASIMATGAMFMIVGQAFVNLCVAIGIFPVTGVPLPMVSNGGSSQLAMGIAFGLIHSALREVRLAEGSNPEHAAAL